MNSAEEEVLHNGNRIEIMSESK